MSFSERYRNKIILAPMVRIGTLPMRILCLRYGADLVYTEELIDWKLMKSVRKVNDALGTVDYIDPSDGCVIFRTCQEEKAKVILQIGTCCPDRALTVAKLIEKDVAGIDVNMGCPKEFSIKGGMGAALLSNVDKAESILRSLVGGVNIPVTCKIRVLESEEDTLALCLRLQETGIAAIAVHGRTKQERPQHSNRNTLIRKIAETLWIPVIANGGSKEMGRHEDILEFKEKTGCSSVMIARAAEWNASIIRREGLLPREEVVKEYLRLAVVFGNTFTNTKYCIQNILRELQESEVGKATLHAQTICQLCELWGLSEFYKTSSTCEGDNRWIEVAGCGVRARCRFLRGLYVHSVELPKSRLIRYSHKSGLSPPVYETVTKDKLFQSSVTLAGVKYTSLVWEKNKRFAEQSAAIVALSSLGLLDKNDLKKYGAFQ